MSDETLIIKGVSMSNENLIREYCEDAILDFMYLKPHIYKALNKLCNASRRDGVKCGIIIALNCIDGRDDTLFKKIVQTTGSDILKEIELNGSDKTKETAKRIFKIKK